MLFLSVLFLPIQAQDVTESEVKATLLLKFTAFVDWPPPAAGQQREHFVFGLLGEDPFGDLMLQLEGQRIKGKPLKIMRIEKVEDLAACQMVFIAASEDERLEELLQVLSKLPILTVGDRPGLAALGIMINFFQEDETIQFEINPKAGRRVGLKIGSKLLRLAKIVNDRRGS